jgi:methionyl-tRNA synthetase
MSAVYTSELANGLGNLASRVAAMIGKYFDGVLPEPGTAGPAEQLVSARLADAVLTAEAAMDRLALHDAIGAVEEFVSAVNGYVTEQEPWKVAKDTTEEGRARLATILWTSAEALRAVAVLHAPTMPKTAARLWESFGAAEQLGLLADQDIRDAGRWGQLAAGATVTKPESLFPRLPDDA